MHRSRTHRVIRMAWVGLLAVAQAGACAPTRGNSPPDGGEGGGDADADGDSDGDGDGDGDDDADADEVEREVILPDCSACPAVGTELENLRCAIDLCDDDVFIEQSYTSPTITDPVRLARSRAAIARFGSETNDLAPLYPEENGSYVVMATGFAVPATPPNPYDHNQSLGATWLNPDGPSVPDPHGNDEDLAYDVVEWTLRLRAPEEAHGFQVHFVFFSVEFDEYVGQAFNDRFYMLLDASSTAGMEHPIINYTECRPSVAVPEFICPPGCRAVRRAMSCAT